MIDTRRLVDRLRLGEDRAVSELTAGRRSIVPVHLGLGPTTIGEVLDLIAEDNTLTPPRTGHLGNWADIAATRAGPMDFNTAVCAGGHGYPLIYGFTRTEADTEGGDDVYAPGSFIEGGRRRPLQLYTWNGRKFAPRDRSVPLMCAMVQAHDGNSRRALVEIMWQRMTNETGYEFGSWAGVLLRNRDLVADMLTELLEHAAGQGRTQAFDEIISHAVALDGTVGRGALGRDGEAFVLDGERFADARAVADAALMLVSALVHPESFFGAIADMPRKLPVISLQVSSVLFALLGTHRERGARGPQPESPYLVHMHWGARAMAGAPPRNSGYLMRRTAQRNLRRLVDPLVGKFSAVQPTVFALLPSSVFMLCPPDRLPRDVELLTELFMNVRSENVEEVGQTTRDWLERRRTDLSPYLLQRFSPEAGVPRQGAQLPAGTPVEPSGFRGLTFAQACAVVAALAESHA